MTEKTSTINLKGSCLCGGVKIEAKEAKTQLGACHCRMCTRWGGGPLLALDCGQDVSFSNDAGISKFASSDWAERGFCKQCGTHLFYLLKSNGQYIMPAGLFEKTDELNFDHQIFIDEKPPYYAFANDTHNMTGAEVFASFSNPDSE